MAMLYSKVVGKQTIRGGSLKECPSNFHMVELMLQFLCVDKVSNVYASHFATSVLATIRKSLTPTLAELPAKINNYFKSATPFLPQHAQIGSYVRLTLTIPAEWIPTIQAEADSTAEAICSRSA
jgi:hypothetical protein